MSRETITKGTGESHKCIFEFTIKEDMSAIDSISLSISGLDSPKITFVELTKTIENYESFPIGLYYVTNVNCESLALLPESPEQKWLFQKGDKLRIYVQANNPAFITCEVVS